MSVVSHPRAGFATGVFQAVDELSQVPADSLTGAALLHLHELAFRTDSVFIKYFVTSFVALVAVPFLAVLDCCLAIPIVALAAVSPSTLLTHSLERTASHILSIGAVFLRLIPYWSGKADFPFCVSMKKRPKTLPLFVVLKVCRDEPFIQELARRCQASSRSPEERALMRWSLSPTGRAAIQNRGLFALSDQQHRLLTREMAIQSKDPEIISLYYGNQSLQTKEQLILHLYQLSLDAPNVQDKRFYRDLAVQFYSTTSFVSDSWFEQDVGQRLRNSLLILALNGRDQPLIREILLTLELSDRDDILVRLYEHSLSLHNPQRPLEGLSIREKIQGALNQCTERTIDRLLETAVQRQDARFILEILDRRGTVPEASALRIYELSCTLPNKGLHRLLESKMGDRLFSYSSRFKASLLQAALQRRDISFIVKVLNTGISVPSREMVNLYKVSVLPEARTQWQIFQQSIYSSLAMTLAEDRLNLLRAAIVENDPSFVSKLIAHYVIDPPIFALLAKRVLSEPQPSLWDAAGEYAAVCLNLGAPSRAGDQWKESLFFCLKTPYWPSHPKLIASLIVRAPPLTKALKLPLVELEGLTILEYCLRFSGNIDLIRTVLYKFDTTPSPKSASLALRHPNRNELLKSLFTHQLSVNCRLPDGDTLLTYAVATQDVPLVKFLLEWGVDKDRRSEYPIRYGWIPLEIARSLSDSDIKTTLLNLLREPEPQAPPPPFFGRGAAADSKSNFSRGAQAPEDEEDIYGPPPPRPRPRASAPPPPPRSAASALSPTAGIWSDERIKKALEVTSFGLYQADLKKAMLADNPWLLFGSETPMTKRALDKEYRKRRGEVHPDKNPEQIGAANAMFIAFEAVYEKLNP